MTIGLLLIALSLLVATAGDERRHLVLSRTTQEALIDRRPRAAGVRGARLSGGLAAAAVLLILPSALGLLVAACLAVTVPFALGKVQTRRERDQQLKASRSLPLVLDLLAAAWRSGVPTLRAVECVAVATPQPLGDDLAAVAGRLALGADVEQAWAAFSWNDEAQVARDALVAASRSGASPVDILHRSAQQARDARRRRGEAAARAVAVRVAAPLGLCFLPAFVLLAIAPAVLGAISPALG